MLLLKILTVTLPLGLMLLGVFCFIPNSKDDPAGRGMAQGFGLALIGCGFLVGLVESMIWQLVYLFSS